MVCCVTEVSVMRMLFVWVLVLSSFSFFPSATAQETATVVNTGGQSLNCRTSPHGSIITSFPAGATVSLRGAPENGWYPVFCADQHGWASADFLSVGGDIPAPQPEPEPGPSGISVELTVVNTSGQSLNCRASYPNGSILARLPAGSTVTSRGDPQEGWWPVTCDGLQGWASGAYLTQGSAPSSPEQPPQQPSGESVSLTVVNTGGQNLNCRSSYPSGGVIASLSAGSTVMSRGAQENGWWPVTCAGQAGWASGAYLTTGSAPPSEQPSGNGSVVDYALQYVGYPYVWAGNHPSTGFDCSGFTYWVFLNTTGMNIGTGTATQASLGSHVAWGEWQPGDLLFFTGTGGSGYYSHVALYIGDGQMVHAQNEATGVLVSSVYSNYYTSHYAMAKRL